VLGLQDTPLWLALTISFTGMAIATIIVQIGLVPWQRRKLSRESESTIITKHPKEIESGKYNNGSDLSVATITISRDSLEKPIIQEESPKVTFLFHYLQTLTAIFTSFVHGGKFTGIFNLQILI
jgi:phosphate/sulfate permease